MTIIDETPTAALRRLRDEEVVDFEGKRLICDAPVYVATAAESIHNLDLHPVTVSFLRTGIIQDSRVEDAK